MANASTPRFSLPTLVLLLAVLGAFFQSAPVRAQTLQPPFDGDYALTDLGPVPGLPLPYGGLIFMPGDPNTLLIGGHANSTAGALYTIGLTRGADNRITGFTGSATFFADADGVAGGIDGGLIFGPGGVILYTSYSDNRLGQIKPGSTAPDKLINLSAPAIGIASSVGTLIFVPSGFPGAGTLKIVQFNSPGNWYDVTLAPDGSGTFDITSTTFKVATSGGPEGVIYVAAGNPQFSAPGMLVSEWSANRVSAYDVDAGGSPIPATRRDFITNLQGAEGAIVDPLTGDFLFSTFVRNTTGNRVIAVRGFVPPVALDYFMCYRTKSTKGDLCSDEAEVNAGGTCETEEDCGGTSGDEDTDATSLCLPNKFPKGLRVSLVDQLEARTRIFDVKKPINLCAPTDKNGEGIGDSSTHLQGFQLVLTKGKCAAAAPANPDRGCAKETDCGGRPGATTFCVTQAKPVAHTNIAVTNQFHVAGNPLRIDALKADRLLVPTAKGLTEPVDLPAQSEVDHYKCYRTKASKGAPKFAPIPAVALDDQFTEGPRVFSLTKPTRLCTPTDKNDEGIKNASTGLMCYQAKAVKGVCVAGAPTNVGGTCGKEQDCGGSKQTHFCELQPKFQKVVGLFVNNQFGPEQVDTTKEDEFCAPSGISQLD